ncbi:peptidoglycan-binding protein, partial [bacterium]
EYYSPNLQALQYLLRSRGFFKGTVNGLSGQKTTASIKAFQRAKHLPITGIARQRELQLLVVPLQPGAKGDQVRAAQILARAAYGADGDCPNLGLEMDGYYGAETEEAIRRAQKGLNQESTLLTVNGIMMTRTWCLLMNGRVSQ